MKKEELEKIKANLESLMEKVNNLLVEEEREKEDESFCVAVLNYGVYRVFPVESISCEEEKEAMEIRAKSAILCQLFNKEVDKLTESFNVTNSFDEPIMTIEPLNDFKLGRFSFDLDDKDVVVFVYSKVDLDIEHVMPEITENLLKSKYPSSMFDSDGNEIFIDYHKF